MASILYHQLQRPLLSSSPLGAKLLTPSSLEPDVIFSWTRRLGTRIARPCPYTFASTENHHQDRKRTGWGTMRTRQASVFFFIRSWTGWRELLWFGFELRREQCVCGSFSSGSDEPGSDTMWDLRALAVYVYEKPLKAKIRSWTSWIRGLMKLVWTWIRNKETLRD